MKKTLKKLSDSTLGKLIVAIVIPGGLIVWGLYELSRLRNGTKNEGISEEEKLKSNSG